MVHNCRAEISLRPVSQDVHLGTTFYLYRLNHVAHTLQLFGNCIPSVSLAANYYVTCDN